MKGINRVVANKKVQTVATVDAGLNKPILVVTGHFIKPVEARIESEYEVRRKADGTSKVGPTWGWLRSTISMPS